MRILHVSHNQRINAIQHKLHNNATNGKEAELTLRTGPGDPVGDHEAVSASVFEVKGYSVCVKSFVEAVPIKTEIMKN